MIDYSKKETMKGFYEIIFEYQSNRVILEKIEEFININKCIEKMIEYLFDEEIIDLINKIFINETYY
jgi:hypothetical protein